MTNSYIVSVCEYSLSLVTVWETCIHKWSNHCLPVCCNVCLIATAQLYLEVPLFGVEIFGVSLSEPHASVTALRTCVYDCLLACLDQPLTINFKWTYSNFSRRSILWSMWKPSGGLLSECSISNSEWRRLKLMHEWQLNSDLCFYRRRQTTHRWYKYGW